MKTLLTAFALGLATLIALPAAGQTPQGSSLPNLTAEGPNILPKGCSCSGDGCSCSCTGAGCLCICGPGGCDCGNEGSAPLAVSLPAGATVSSAAETVSAGGPMAPHVVVLAGGDQVLPFDINTTSWQAIARLSMLPGVRLGVAAPNPKSLARKARQRMLGLPSSGAEPTSGVREIQRTPLSQTISLCVHQDAGLPAVLEGLSRYSGYAFDVSGTPAPHFTLTAKGTLDELVSQLSAAAGVNITILQ